MQVYGCNIWGGSPLEGSKKMQGGEKNIFCDELVVEGTGLNPDIAVLQKIQPMTSRYIFISVP